MNPLTSLISNASPKSLAAASFGMGSIASYLWMRSKSNTPFRDIKEVLMFLKWKKDLESKLKSDWSLVDKIEETVLNNLNRPCITYVNDGRTLTWCEFNEKVNQGSFFFFFNLYIFFFFK